MIAEETSRNIDTIEEFSLFSLDQSQRGLDLLLDETAACGAALTGENASDGLEKLYNLVQALHDFDLFENELCSLFNLDRKSFEDSRGTLESNVNLFHKALNDIGSKLEQNDMKSLGGLVTKELSKSLARFKDLLPLIRKHIDKEYVQAENTE